MKKLLSLCLSFALLLTFTGCEKTDTEQPSSNNNQPTNNEVVDGKVVIKGEDDVLKRQVCVVDNEKVKIEVVGAKLLPEGTVVGQIEVDIENKTDEPVHLGITGENIVEYVSEAFLVVKGHESQRVTLVYQAQYFNEEPANIAFYDNLAIAFSVQTNSDNGWIENDLYEATLYATSIGGPYDRD